MNLILRIETLFRSANESNQIRKYFHPMFNAPYPQHVGNMLSVMIGEVFEVFPNEEGSVQKLGKRQHNGLRGLHKQ